MVIDYRLLYNNTVDESYLIPGKENLIQLIADRKWFTKLDCKSRFWQFAMAEESIPWTAFQLPQGKYEWLVMPFGLKNAPQIFQRRMDKVFRPHQDYCLVYIDDILVASKTPEDHKINVEAII